MEMARAIEVTKHSISSRLWFPFGLCTAVTQNTNTPSAKLPRHVKAQPSAWVSNLGTDRYGRTKHLPRSHQLPPLALFPSNSTSLDSSKKLESFQPIVGRYILYRAYVQLFFFPIRNLSE